MPKKNVIPNPRTPEATTEPDITAELVSALNVLAHHVDRVKAEGELTGMDVTLAEIVRLAPLLVEDYIAAWDALDITRACVTELESKLAGAMNTPTRTASGIVLPT